MIWTSRLNKLEIYRKLGVREVWVWKSGGVRVFVLPEGTYEEVSASAVLPGLNVTELVSFAPAGADREHSVTTAGGPKASTT